MKQVCQKSADTSFWNKGGAWVVIQALLMGGVVGLGLLFHSSQRSLVSSILGAVFMCAGAAVAIAGALALGMSLSPFPKPLPNANLVKHGIYSRIRHPLYASIIL